MSNLPPRNPLDRTSEAAPTEVTNEIVKPVDISRRRLTGAGLGVSAIFTLASRPVWANQCSISGMASGNLSAPNVACNGCTPGYWKVCNHLGSWAATGYNPTMTFNAVFGVLDYVDCNNNPYTLLDVLCLNGGQYKCTGPEANRNQDAHPAGAPSDCTNGDAFGDLGGDPVSVNLGFHAVAALLNAAHPAVNYGYTSGELIQLFKNNYGSDPEGLKNSLEMMNERKPCPLGNI